MELPFLLCGPLLRRTERSGVYIWVATAEETTSITAQVFTLAKNINGEWDQTPVAVQADCTTHQLGRNLFVSLICVKAASGMFDVNKPYGYDLQFSLKNKVPIRRFTFPGPPEPAVSLQAFLFSEIYNYAKDKPFSYAKMPYPVFVIPDTSKAESRIIYGSCRRTNGPGSDALNGADKLLVKEWDAWSLNKQNPVPSYVLFHLGDQIYTDDLNRELFDRVLGLARDLMGVYETIPCYKVPGRPLKDDIGVFDFIVFLEKYLQGEKGYQIQDAKILTWIEYTDHHTEAGRRKNILTLVKEYLSTIYKAEIPSAVVRAFLEGKASVRLLIYTSILDAVGPDKVAAKRSDMDEVIGLLDKETSVIDSNEILPRYYLTDPKQKTKDVAALSILYDERKPFLRINSSFTTSDNGHLLTFGELAALYLLNWGSFYLFLLPPLGDINHGNLEGLITGNMKVRRLMANVPSYMIFDDHDVTDDWNGDETWRHRVEHSVTGKRVVANALAAYWAFQGWGNTPEVFAKHPELVKAITQHLGQITTGGVENPSFAAHFEKITWAFDKWAFVAPTNPVSVFMDTRTMRGKEGRMDYLPEYLPDTQLSGMLDFLTDAAILTAAGALTKQQLITKPASILLSVPLLQNAAAKEHRDADSLKNNYLAVSMLTDKAYEQLQTLILASGYKPGDSIVFCAATPVVCSYLLQKAQKKVVDGSMNKDYLMIFRSKFVPTGRFRQDWELWWCYPKGKYEFFKFLDLKLMPKRVMILSGDVHIGFHISGTLNSEVSGRSIKVEQLCSSALKNNQLGKQEGTDKLAYFSLADTKDIEYKKILEKYSIPGSPLKKNHFTLQAQLRKYSPVMDPDAWLIWENNVGVMHYNDSKGQDQLQNEFLFSRGYNAPVVHCKVQGISPERDAFLNHARQFIPLADAMLLWNAVKTLR